MVAPATLRDRHELPASTSPDARTELLHILAANRSGRRIGAYAVCSAHPIALEAALRQAVRDGTIVLLEATANQVNQFGGYTGMRPADYRARVDGLARQAGISTDRILLGGDHLGPVCWAAEPAETALANARDLIKAFVTAGFTKIHLDASMPCRGDGERLSDDIVAMRAADLCGTAERTAIDRFGTSDLIYVIGTEVPAPGGGRPLACECTEAASVERTVEAHAKAFRRAGLHRAWQRVVALVVQPGIDFDNASVRDYDPAEAKPLRDIISRIPKLVYEAHSTDYQTAEAIAALVRDHFALLKVGPQLTYAIRQALFALAYIEAELVPASRRARLPEVCERVMLESPRYWDGYCAGNGQSGCVARRFGYSDRIRYYWARPAIASAVAAMMRNLSSVHIPAPLLEQHLPLQYDAVRAGALVPSPRALVLDHVMRVTERYARACDPDDTPTAQTAMEHG